MNFKGIDYAFTQDFKKMVRLITFMKRGVKKICITIDVSETNSGETLRFRSEKKANEHYAKLCFEMNLMTVNHKYIS